MNGLERPEDVDISSIGRISPAYANQQIQNLNAPKGGYATPASTSAGVDALFSRFGVKEVRSISSRGTSLAEAKREELRTMVGARYRDLLGAADSIVRMRKASTSLLGKLAKARDECDRETMTARAQESDMTRSRVIMQRAASPLPGGTDQDLQGHTPYSIATLVKLLLDAPEHIWRLIEREDYLSAARLEGIGRKVYRELASTGRTGRSTWVTSGPAGEAVLDGRDAESDQEGDEQDDLLAAFPLMQTTGDILDQLRPQISQRAKLHLRTWEAPERSVTESLASIVMLDNTAIPEVLEMLLDQRSKSLSAIFSSDPNTPASSRRLSTMPTSAIRASMSGLPQTNASAADPKVDLVIQRVQEGLGCILRTLQHTESVFSDSIGTRAGLLALLAEIQQTPSAAEATSDKALSFLASSPAKASFAVTEKQLSPILNTLSNAPVLLRYLPSQILSFTPFIDTSSARNELPGHHISAKLGHWFKAALTTSESGAGNLFAILETASQLATVQETLLAFLSAQGTVAAWTGQIDHLRTSLLQLLERRFVEIYTGRLAGLTDSLPGLLDIALRAASSSQEDLDITDFLLAMTTESAAVYGSIPFAALNSSTTIGGPDRGGGYATAPSYVAELCPARQAHQRDAFEAFKAAMRMRVQGRPPVLDTCLCGLEDRAQRIRRDVERWLASDARASEGIRKQYLGAVQQSFDQMQQNFNSCLDRQESEASRLLLGNLALHLARQSSFLVDLSLAESAEDGQSPLLDITEFGD